MRKLSSLLLALSLTATAANAQKLNVHEWGTFTTMHGSDGSTLSGLYYEEEQLPSFVYHFPGFSPDPIRKECKNVTVKMETPVLYFYSATEQNVKVHVDFPHGSITQWYPTRSGGEVFPTGEDNLDFAAENRVGSIDWDATVLDPKSTAPYSGTNASQKWNDPRNTSSNLVQTSNGETEKFLFYRGLANFSLPVSVKFDQSGNLVVQNTSSENIPFIYIYDNLSKPDQIGIWGIGPVDAGSTMVYQKPTKYLAAYEVVSGTDSIHAKFKTALVNAGLTFLEAAAMLKTWDDGYFQTEGFKAFWIVPRTLTDAILPISISPKPDSLERVLVGKTEILPPSFEAQLLADYQSGQFDSKWSNHHYYVAYKQRVLQLAGSASVATVDGSNGILIAPNPASTTIRFLLPNASTSTYHLTIRDILGNTVVNTAITTISEIDIHTLPAGVYITTISDGNQHWNSKLIKQ